MGATHYDRYNIQLDLRPFYKNTPGGLTEVARRFGLNTANIGSFLIQPPLSVATGLAAENEFVRRRILTEPRPFLVERGRGWRVPDQLAQLDYKFRQEVGRIVFSVAGGGSMMLQATATPEEPVVEPLPPPAELALEALKELCTRLMIDRDEALRELALKTTRLAQLEPENEALKARVRDAERMVDDAVVKIPVARETKVPTASIEAAMKLVPSLTQELARLPKR